MHASVDQYKFSHRKVQFDTPVYVEVAFCERRRAGGDSDATGHYGSSAPEWGLITLAIATPGIAELQVRFKELLETNRQ
eukprot:scaffold357923_cov19-Prasinocladus_malaysianus.AAC.1